MKNGRVDGSYLITFCFISNLRKILEKFIQIGHKNEAEYQ